MPKPIIWAPAAEKDLQNILDYLNENWNRKAVFSFIRRLESQIELISQDPQIFPIIQKQLQVRKSVITKHNSLFYRITKSSVQIIRIFDSRQNPKKLRF